MKAYLLNEKMMLDGSPFDCELVGIYTDIRRANRDKKTLNEKYPEKTFSIEEVPTNKLLVFLEK